MAFSFGAESEDEEQLNASINTTPLVDVMLVLLIIFLLTIPVALHTVPVSLPKEANHPNEVKPQTILLSVTSEGEIYWNDQPVPDYAALLTRLKAAAPLTPQPEVQIRGDEKARYEAIGRLVLACQKAGLGKVGFITEPPPRG